MDRHSLMPTPDQFPKSPPIRLRLTKAQARKIEEAREAGEGVMVCGYARRHPWPEPGRFTLCAWFVDQDALREAMKAAGVMMPESYQSVKDGVK